MHIQFNRPVTLGEVTYGVGVHEVSAADAKGWFFDALVKDGEIAVLRRGMEPEVTKTEPVQEKPVQEKPVHKPPVK